jgi:hypothetical protein
MSNVCCRLSACTSAGSQNESQGHAQVTWATCPASLCHYTIYNQEDDANWFFPLPVHSRQSHDSRYHSWHAAAQPNMAVPRAAICEAQLTLGHSLPAAPQGI